MNGKYVINLGRLPSFLQIEDPSVKGGGEKR